MSKPSSTLRTGGKKPVQAPAHSGASGANAATMEPGHEIPLSREEAARLIAYSPQTLANLAVLGRGPKFYSTRRKVFYFPSDVLAWVRSLEQHGKGTAA